MLKTIGYFIFLICAFILFSFIVSIVIPFQIVRKLYRKEDLAEYFKVCAIGEDQRAGSYLYGTEDWTISSYTYYLHTKGNKYATILMKVIDFFAKVFEDEHCKNTYEREKQELHNGGASMNKIKEI